MTTKGHLMTTIDMNVLEAARQSGLNMSEVCENALKNAVDYCGDPDETKRNLESERQKHENALKAIAEKEKLIGSKQEIHDRIISDADVLYVMNSWTLGSAKDVGLISTIKRKYGIVLTAKAITELVDELKKEGLTKCPDCGAKNLTYAVKRKQPFLCPKCQKVLK